MKRRRLLQCAAALPMLPLPGVSDVACAAPKALASRVRPSDGAWPTFSEWDELRQRAGGRLVALRSPLDACRTAPDSETCRDLFRELKNPYFIGDNPALTQTCGWVGAWTAEPSAYAVAAQSTADVVAAVDFARRKNLRLVIRGGGHSYLGTSSARDSLLIWTRAMNDLVLDEAFVPRGGEGNVAPVPAVTIGAGAIWAQVYEAVTTRSGRYVQGGGCLTVGVAGLVQGGGFGTHSKAFGTAGSSLLQAEIMTADGLLRTTNAHRDPELFWALKGGGGGSFGVVTRLTLRTWALPASFGMVSTTIRATSDDAFRQLIEAFVAFYAENLCNTHWGELVRIMPNNRLEISMNSQGLDKTQTADIWRPFLAWVTTHDNLAVAPPAIFAGPGRYRWDGSALEKYMPKAIRRDDRLAAPATNFFWTANLAEAGHVIYDFESLWLPAELLRPRARPEP